MNLRLVHFNRDAQPARSAVRPSVVLVQPGHQLRWSQSSDRRVETRERTALRAGRLDLRVAIPLVAILAVLCWWALIEIFLAV